MDRFLSDKEISNLRMRHKACKDKRFADRIKAILMLNNGLSFQEVADYLLLDDDTIRNHYNIFIEEGVDGLMKDLYEGGAPRLSVVEQKELEHHLMDHTYGSAKEICRWVKQQWSISYTVPGMTDLLHRMNFTYKKPKLIPGKADEKAQKKFVTLYKKLQRKKDKKDQIYFADGCHPMLNPIAGYGWIKKGTNKEIPSNTGREHLNLNGAYNAETKQAIIHESAQINAQSTIALFEKIKQKQPEGKIIFISDNAKYYRAKILKNYLQNNRRIRMQYLPSYSPNLNLIERLWKFYKKKILYHRHYSTIDEMREASLKFFCQLKKYTAELNTLMTENFQIIKPKFSETCVL
jgi:transposase